MSESNLVRILARALSRTLIVMAMVFSAALLSGCGGGLFGTDDGGDLNVAPGENASATESAGDENLPAAGEDIPPPESTPDMNTGSPEVDTELQPLTLNFSNTTPSGIDPDNAVVPALKLINLTEFTLTVRTVGQIANVPPQGTSGLLGVNIGESLVDINIQDSPSTLVSVMPLNAAIDSITTLVIETQNQDPDITGEQVSVSLLALDTRAVATTSGMADIRVVSTAAASSAQTRFTLSPMASNSSGAELVLGNANGDNPGVGVYASANAGDYLLSSSESDFVPVPITLLADGVYTIVVTGNSEAPVYVEVDSLSGVE